MGSVAENTDRMSIHSSLRAAAGVMLSTARRMDEVLADSLTEAEALERIVPEVEAFYAAMETIDRELGE